MSDPIVYNLTLEEQAAANGANVRVEVTHAALTEATANTAQTIPLLNVTAKMAVRLVKAVLVTPFKDASDAAFNTTPVTVGDGSVVDRLLASMELNVNGTEVSIKPGPATGAAAVTYAAPAAVTYAAPSAVPADSVEAVSPTTAQHNLALAAIASTRTNLVALAADEVATRAKLAALAVDVAAIRTALAASNCHVFTGDDTVDLVVGSMSGKALADIDTGALHLFFQVMT